MCTGDNDDIHPMGRREDNEKYDPILSSFGFLRGHKQRVGRGHKLLDVVIELEQQNKKPVRRETAMGNEFLNKEIH